MEKAGDNAVQEFKASQSYINSCADYYGIEFDDCLKQVASAFPELDLSGIIMEEFVSTTPTGDTIAGESDDPKNDNVILAQPAPNPPIPTSNPSIELLDIVEDKLFTPYGFISLATRTTSTLSWILGKSLLKSKRAHIYTKKRQSP